MYGHIYLQEKWVITHVMLTLTKDICHHQYLLIQAFSFFLFNYNIAKALILKQNCYKSKVVVVIAAVVIKVVG